MAIVLFVVLLAAACGFAFRTASIAPAWLCLCASGAWSAVRWFFAWLWSMDNPLAFILVGGACLWLNKGMNMYIDAVRRRAVVKGLGKASLLGYLFRWPRLLWKDLQEREYAENAAKDDFAYRKASDISIKEDRAVDGVEVRKNLNEGEKAKALRRCGLGAPE